MRVPAKAEVQRAHAQFILIVGLCALTIIALHLLPKNTRPRDSARLICTIAYFAVWLGLCFVMNRPRARCQDLYFQWIYEDAPLGLQRCWRRYLFSLNEVVRLYCWISAGFVLSTGLGALALWFPPLGKLALAYNGVWWLCVVAFALAPFLGGYLLQELSQRWRMLREQVELLPRFRARSVRDLYAPGSDTPSPLEFADQGSFRAGGVHWTWPGLAGNVLIFGQPGSGKTSCVLTSMLEGMIGAGRGLPLPPGGLLLDPKGDFLGPLRALCRRYGRTDDLLVLNPDDLPHSIHWNPLDSAEDEIELAGRFTAAMENLGMRSAETSFWIDTSRKFLRHAIALLRITNPQGEPPSFRQLQRLATDMDAIADLLPAVTPGDARGQECLHFFSHEWCALADETRTSAAAHITNMIDPFLMEPYLSLFAGRSTCRIDAMVESGKILYLHMPLGGKELMARTIGVLMKLEYFHAVKQRTLTKTRPTFFFCDEFQTFFTAAPGRSDADFFDRSRQALHCNMVASQSLPNLRKYCTQPDVVASLLGLCLTKVFLQNIEPETNTYASNLFGQHLVPLGGSSGSLDGGRMRSLAQSASVSDQYDLVLRPERLTELMVPHVGQAIPSCEAIIHRGGTDTDHNDRPKVRWRRHVIEAKE